MPENPQVSSESADAPLGGSPAGPPGPPFQAAAKRGPLCALLF